MIDCLLMGTKKHGCQINNKDNELIYYEYLSFYEKMKKKNPILTLNYSQIENVKVCYGLTTGVRFDSAQITLEITTFDKNKYDIPITYYNTQRDDLKLFIKILQNSTLDIDDPYNILNQALETELDLITFIKEINKQIYSKN